MKVNNEVTLLPQLCANEEPIRKANKKNFTKFGKRPLIGRLPEQYNYFLKLNWQRKFNITHVIVTKFTASSSMTMNWECLSDDPILYDSLEIK